MDFLSCMLGDKLSLSKISTFKSSPTIFTRNGSFSWEYKIMIVHYITISAGELTETKEISLYKNYERYKIHVYDSPHYTNYNKLLNIYNKSLILCCRHILHLVMFDDLKFVDDNIYRIILAYIDYDLIQNPDKENKPNQWYLWSFAKKYNGVEIMSQLSCIDQYIDYCNFSGYYPIMSTCIKIGKNITLKYEYIMQKKS